jgi:predicted  nucleic acid-binding Zn-ribbon protein
MVNELDTSPTTYTDHIKDQSLVAELNHQKAANELLNKDLRAARQQVQQLEREKSELASKLKEAPKNISITVNNSNYACMQYGGAP